MFLRTKTNGKLTYLQLVESVRRGSSVRQRIIASLGRLDRLQAGGLDRFLASGARFSLRSAMLAADSRRSGEGSECRVLGPALVLESLWATTGCGEAVRQTLDKRSFRFDAEKAVFLTVLHRLFARGRNRASLRWAADLAVEGTSDLGLSQLYRTMAWLGQPLGPDSLEADPAYPPYCAKDELDAQLFARRRDLFTGLDMVYLHLTVQYFHGQGRESPGQRGRSRDAASHSSRVLAGIVCDARGRLLCTEIWMGAVPDASALLAFGQRLKDGYGVLAVCLVADQSCIRDDTLAEMARNGWSYVVGSRMQSMGPRRESLLEDAVDEVRVPSGSAGPNEPERWETGESDRQAGEGDNRERRCILVRDESRAWRDREKRLRILSTLRDRLEQVPPSTSLDAAYGRYLSSDGDTPCVDLNRVSAEERFDGLWALQANAPLTAAQVAAQYWHFREVDRFFQQARMQLQLGPVYRRREDTIRGHLFCASLALLVKWDLKLLMQQSGINVEWPDLVQDLDSLREIVVEAQGKRFAVRTRPRGAVMSILRSMGIDFSPVELQLDSRASPPAAAMPG